MVFSDTTNKNGIIQTIERWTNLTDGAITGDATLLKQFTASVNDAFDTLMPLLLSFSNYLKWDDENNTDLPVGTLNIVSGQPDYTIAQDANALSILNITAVRILPSATATNYIDIDEMTIDDHTDSSIGVFNASNEAISPNTNFTGVPYKWLKRGNTIFLFPKPNYSVTAGIKIFFERQESYFASTDTTKVPGIPKPFHVLLALYPSLEWTLINDPQNGNLITRIEARIARTENALRRAIEGRNPRRAIMTQKRINFL